MALSAQQLADMDKIAGQGLSSSDLNAMDAIVAGKQEAPSPFAGESAAERFARGVAEGIGQAGLGVVQGATELIAPTGGVNTLTGDLKGVKKALTDTVDASRARVSQMGTAGKVGEVGGNIAGSLPFLAAGSELVGGKAVGALGKIATGTVTGAGQGAIQATGTGESRAGNIAKGATIGGVFGGTAAGAGLAGKGVKYLAQTGKLNPEAAGELASQGIDATRIAAGNDNAGSNFVRGYLRNTFIGGKFVEAAGKRANAQVEAATDRVIGQIGDTLDAAGAGEKLISGMNAAKRAFQDEADKLYSKADSLIPETTRIHPKNTLAVARQKTSMLSSELQKSLAEPTTQGVRQAVSNEVGGSSASLVNQFGKPLTSEFGSTTYGKLKEIRTLVGNNIEDTPFNSPQNRFYKRLYGALSRDMEAAAKTLGNGADEALNQANSFYRSGRNELEKQFQRYGGKGDAEQAFKTLNSPDAFRNAPQRVTQLLARLPQASRKAIGATIIRRMGQKADGGEFDPISFATKWSSIAPKAKNALAGGGAMAEELDKLVRNIKRVYPLIEKVPPTGQVATGRGSDAVAAVSLFAAPWLSAVKFGLDTGLGWLLTKPQNVKLLNRAIDSGKPGVLRLALKDMAKMAKSPEALKAITLLANQLSNGN